MMPRHDVNLPDPIVRDIRGPSGPDIAAEFGATLVLTYWDLWCLLAAQLRFNGNLSALRDFLIHRRRTENFWSYHRRELVEDLITLTEDLLGRLRQHALVPDVVARLPERLVKKESQKAIRNILEQEGSYPPSEPMLRSPRRLLTREAYRGMWPGLPVDPTLFADRFAPLLKPPAKHGYFPKGQTFTLARKVEKRIAQELAMDGTFTNPYAHRYAVFRAALTLFHEEHTWDDSYGAMGDLGKVWIEELLLVTPTLVGSDPRFFLKDLFMFLVWENYGLSMPDQIAKYVRDKLSADERVIVIEILTLVADWCERGFMDYQAGEAARILEGIGVSVAPAKRTGHLRLIGTTPGCDTR
jgi:hypothetical protein